MLKKIPAILSPELVKLLMEMGHGDEIVFGDANFPGASLAKRLVRYEGVQIRPLLEAVLTLFPLDYRVTPAAVMAIPADSGYEGNIHEEYRELLTRYNDGREVAFDVMERQDFYDRASRAHAVVVTGDFTRFANLIIRKGVVQP